MWILNDPLIELSLFFLIRNHENFVQEAFVDFIMVQIKTISFIAFMIKHRYIQSYILYSTTGTIGKLL